MRVAAMCVTMLLNGCVVVASQRVPTHTARRPSARSPKTNNRSVRYSELHSDFGFSDDSESPATPSFLRHHRAPRGSTEASGAHSSSLFAPLYEKENEAQGLDQDEQREDGEGGAVVSNGSSLFSADVWKDSIFGYEVSAHRHTCVSPV